MAEFKYRSANEMKDSGVEWLGAIPEDWKMTRMKYNGESIIGLTYAPEDVVDNNGSLVLRSSNVQNNKIDLNDTVYVSKKIPFKLITKEGDILICSRNGSRALIGKNAYIDGASIGYTFGAFMTVFRSGQSRYIYYVFNSPLFSYQSSSYLTATINQLTVNNLNNFVTALPGPLEQQKIANFLDIKTAQFDSIIAKKEQLIQKLEEAKKSLISEVVTGKVKIVDGEMVRRQPEEMKESGVEWLGMVPKEWEIKRIKHISQLRSGESITNESIEVEGHYPVYGGNGIRGYTDSYTHKGKHILIGRQGALCGNINIANGDFWASEHAVVVNIQSDTNIIWFSLLLDSMNLNQYSISAAQPGLAVGMINNLFVPYTSREEQDLISGYLEFESNKFAQLQVKILSQIQKLKQAKQSLISEAVTGKIDLRDWNII